MKITKTNSSKLQLTNDGSLSIYFIGTGSAFVKSLFQNNVVVVKGINPAIVGLIGRIRRRISRN